MNERVRRAVVGMAKVALLLDLVKTWKKHLPEDDFQKLSSAVQDSILLQEALEKALGILTEIAVEFFPGISREILYKWSRDTIELLKEFPEIRELEAIG